MEERMSWGEAFATAVNNLFGVNNSPSVRNVRLLFFLLFLAGSGWAGYSYYQATILLAEKDFSPSGAPSELEADKKRLNSIIDQVKTTSERRKSSSQVAEDMEKTSGKYIVMDPQFYEPVKPPEEPGGTRKDLEPVIVVDMPPEIVVRAIMILGKQQVAVMDIAGVGSGMIVKAGDTFMQKKGRVVRIAPDKVVIRWGGKNWDVAPGF